MCAARTHFYGFWGTGVNLRTARECPRLAFAEQRRLELKQKTPLMGFFRCYLPFCNALTLCAARECPRLPLRREVDACIKDLSRQTEGEIHRVCAKTLDIGKRKGKRPPFHLLLVYTSEQTAPSRYLSLSLLSPQSGGKSQLPPQREPRRLRRRARRLSRRGQGSRERVQFASVAIPYQNVCTRRTLICFSCARRARFMRRRRASCAEGTLHLRHACAVILSFPPAQSGSGDTGKADRAAMKIPPSTPPAEQSPCRKTASALDNHRSQK